MAETKYAKYVITKPMPRKADEPLPHHHIMRDRASLEAAHRPGEGRYLTKDTLPGCPVWVSIGRITGVPDPQPFIDAHKHEADEILLFVAVSPDGELGADVEFSIGDEGEKHTFNKTTVIYIPKGLTHTPIWVKNFRENKFFYLITVLLQSEYY